MRRERRRSRSRSSGLEKLVVMLPMLLMGAVMQRMAMVRGCRGLRRRMMDVMRVILLLMLCLSCMISSDTMRYAYCAGWRKAGGVVNGGSWSNGTR